jgi:magnesium transporter
MVRTMKYSPEKGVQISEGVETASLAKEPGEVLWIDFDQPTGTEFQALADNFNFHPLAVEDCGSESHHPKLDEYEGYVFVVMHGVDFHTTQGEFATSELDIFLGRDYLVTFHRNGMPSVAQAWEEAAKESRIVAAGPDFLLYEVLTRLAEHYLEAIDKFSEKGEEVEDEMFTDVSTKTLEKLTRLKRQVLHLRRVTAPQREVLWRLSREATVVDEKARAYYSDVYDKFYRISETADSNRDILTGLLEAYLSVVSNRLNEVMKVLTIIATIMMPLTVIVGLYGMNFHYMPELNWRYGYAMVWGVMVATAAGLIWYFKRKKWL